jgi:hypothetical protein
MLTDTYLITKEKGLGWMHTAYLLHREEKRNFKIFLFSYCQYGPGHQSINNKAS